MRALAMTGMETAAMMPSIMSGSLIRDTPPWARMSAGTRSRAMTATAPASSAILACSALTTSMMTPPLSISAMPRLTRVVPVPWGFCCSLMALSVGPPRDPLRQGSGPVGTRPHAAPLSARARGQLVVELDGLGQGRVAGEAEHPHDRLAPHPAHLAGGVGVEAAGQLHAQAARGEPVEGLGAELVLVGPHGRHGVVAEGGAQDRAEVALDVLAAAEVLPVEQVVVDRLLGGPLDRLGGGVGDEERARGVERAAVRQLEGGLGPAHELGVEGRHRPLHLGVQPVEPGRRVRQVPGDPDDEDDEERRHLQDVDHQLPPPGPPRTSRPHSPRGEADPSGSATAPSMTVSYTAITRAATTPQSNTLARSSPTAASSSVARGRPAGR